MSWSIGVLHNALTLTEDQFYIFESLAEENDYYPGYNRDGTISFDPDAMEWMDCFSQEWAIDFAKQHKLTGYVIFGSLEGDNSGSFWTHKFVNGEHTKFGTKESLELFLLTM